MNDSEKTKGQLLKELAVLRGRIAAFETAEKLRRDNGPWPSPVLESAALGIHVCDTEGKLTYVNPSQEAITGYSADELLGTYIWDRMVPGPDRGALPVYLKRLVAEQPTPTPYFQRNVKRNGEVFDIRVDWNYKRNEQGEVIGFVSIISDVTEQKRLEAEVRRSRATLQATIECLPFDFFALGPDGRYILQNAASRTHWGDVCGKRPEDVCQSEDNLALWLENNRRAFAGERIEEEVTSTIQGEQRFVVNILAPIRDEKETYGILGVNLDTTDRRRAEEALRQSEERYRNLTESTTDMIYILNRSGNVLYANRSAAEGIRHNATSLAGKRQEELFSPDKVQRHVESIASVFQTGEVYEADGMYHFGDEDIWLNTRLMPLRDERGEVAAVMGVSRNITARKRAEAALKQAHDELERRVEERTAELAEAKRVWERTFDSVPDLIAVLDRSHRIVRVNRAMAERLGVAPEQCVGLTCYETVHGLHSPPEFCPHALTLADGKGHTAEIYEQRLGGNFLVTTTPICDENGQFVGSVHVARDITERKRAEEALVESEAKYRHLVETTDTGYLILDAEGRVVDANDEYVRLTGHSSLAEIAGRTVVEWTAPYDAVRNAEEVAACLRKGMVRQLEVDYIGPDGKVTPIEINASVIAGAQGRRILSLCRDIAERKHAAEALRQSEEKYRGLVDICPDCILVSDLTGTTQFVSKQTWTLLDLPEDEQLVGKSTFDYLIEADRPRLAANLADLLRVGRRPMYTEYTVLRPNGTTVPIELASAVIGSADGRPIATMAIIRNISERKRAQEALQQSEEKYRGLIEISPDAVVVTDLAAKTLFVSPQTWKLLGIPEQVDLAGQNVYDYVIEADRPRLAANIADLLTVGKQSHKEYTLLRPDGTTVPTELSSAVIRDSLGRPTALMAIIRDISDRKRAEETLRQSKEKYRGLIEICPDAVVVTDLTGKAIFVSPQAWRLLGIPEHVDLVGQSVFDYIIEQERVRMVEGIAELLAAGRHKHSEYTGIRPDGSTIPTEISTVVIRDAQGQPIALMAMIRDISDRKQAEEALKKEHRTLKHLLQSSDHERQLIAYEIHDGLTQQLAGAIMQLDTYSYQKDHRPKEAANAYEAAMTMLRQAHYEARRLISGVRPPILDESGIVAAVAHLVNEHRLQNGPKIEFRGDVSFDRLVPIMENAIYRIVQEGLANACKHSNSPRVRVELVEKDGVLQVKVKDWGTGFDPNKVKDDRFGLEGIRERARLLGGHTTMESTAGKGTCVTVELPLALREKE